MLGTVLAEGERAAGSFSPLSHAMWPQSQRIPSVLRKDLEIACPSPAMLQSILRQDTEGSWIWLDVREPSASPWVTGCRNLAVGCQCHKEWLGAVLLAQFVPPVKLPCSA